MREPRLLPRTTRAHHRPAHRAGPPGGLVADAKKRPRPVARSAVRPTRARAEPARRPARPRSRAGAGAGAAGAVVAFVYAQLGEPYVWAGDGPHGFDCSGLTAAAYRQVGIWLPHQTGGQVSRGRPVSRAGLRPGDLVFTDPGHVGIYIGRNRMIHAPHPGASVEISRLWDFWTARRLL